MMRRLISVAAVTMLLGCGDDSEPVGDSAAGSSSSGTSTSGTPSTSSSSTTASGGTAGQTGGAGSTGNPGLGPPYPIVMAHGFFGFDEFAGADFLTYYFEVVDHLAAEGETLVFTPSVDPFNDSTIRGEQLLAEIETIVADTGHAKVNIIGHSQGGLDARVVANLRPDLVASITTIATPHFGSPIADIGVGLLDDPNAAAIIDGLVQLIGAPIWDDIGQQTSVADSLRQFSTEGITEFNDRYPDVPGVLYFSLSGRSGLHPGGPDCDAPDAPPFVTQFEGELDPIDPLFAATEAVLDGGVLGTIPNDGLVRVEDAKWGTWLGCIPADHVDEIGQIFGDTPGLLNEWRHKPFFSDLVAYLRAQGL